MLTKKGQRCIRCGIKIPKNTEIHKHKTVVDCGMVFVDGKRHWVDYGTTKEIKEKKVKKTKW